MSKCRIISLGSYTKITEYMQGIRKRLIKQAGFREAYTQYKQSPEQREKNLAVCQTCYISILADDIISEFTKAIEGTATVCIGVLPEFFWYDMISDGLFKSGSVESGAFFEEDNLCEFSFPMYYRPLYEEVVDNLIRKLTDFTNEQEKFIFFAGTVSRTEKDEAKIYNSLLISAKGEMEIWTKVTSGNYDWSSDIGRKPTEADNEGQNNEKLPVVKYDNHTFSFDICSDFQYGTLAQPYSKKKMETQKTDIHLHICNNYSSISTLITPDSFPAKQFMIRCDLYNETHSTGAESSCSTSDIYVVESDDCRKIQVYSSDELVQYVEYDIEQLSGEIEGKILNDFGTH